MERARRRVLDYFCAPPDEYTAVFTANATAATKLVGEAFPFERGSCCLLTFDNHNSVNGIREYASARGADVVYTRLTTPDLGIDRVDLDARLQTRAPEAPPGELRPLLRAGANARLDRGGPDRVNAPAP